MEEIQDKSYLKEKSKSHIEFIKYLIPALLVFFLMFILTYSKPKTGEIKEQKACTPLKVDDLLENKVSLLEKENRILNTYKNFEIDIQGSNDNFSRYIAGNGETDKLIFSMEYPKSWVRDNSVFTDSSGNKVAEMLPNYDTVSATSCNVGTEFETYRESIQLVSEEKISIGELSGSYTVTATIPEGTNNVGRWYPNSYCLKNDKHFTNIIFYEHQKNPANKELHKQILNTVELN